MAKYIDGYHGIHMPDAMHPLIVESIVNSMRAKLAAGEQVRIVIADANDIDHVAQVLAWSEEQFGQMLPVVSELVSRAEVAKVFRGSRPITEDLIKHVAQPARSASQVVQIAKVLPGS